LVPDPTPRETLSGIIPATNANVVMRIGRSRSRLACTMASARRQPVALSWLAWSICRIESLLHDADEYQEAQRRQDVQTTMLKMMIDRSAKGSSGAATGGS